MVSDSKQRYLDSPKGRATRAKIHKKYRQTEAGKRSNAAASKRYREKRKTAGLDLQHLCQCS